MTNKEAAELNAFLEKWGPDFRVSVQRALDSDAFELRILSSATIGMEYIYYFLKIPSSELDK